MDVVRWEIGIGGVGGIKWNGWQIEGLLCPQILNERSLHFPGLSLLSALYHHCCPAVSVWLSIRNQARSAQPLIRRRQRRG